MRYFLIALFLIVLAVFNATLVKAALIGDINGDGKVTIVDIGIIIDNYGRLPITNSAADLNRDGKIDIVDIGIVIDNYGSASSPSPSPTSSGNINLRPFSPVTIPASDIKFNVNGSGTNVDSMAFWEAPDPNQSLMFVTSKNNSTAEVYRYPFTSELKTISCGSSTNGVWVDQDADVLYLIQRESSNVCAFNLPALTANSAKSFTTAATTGKFEPNLTLLKTNSGQKRIYVSYDNTVYYHDTADGSPLGKFSTVKGLETMYGDDLHKTIYIPDESGRSGVYVYDENGQYKNQKFGDSTVFDSDAEGIWVYKCPSLGSTDNGEGVIVVSDQKATITDFEVFNRKTKQHLGKFNIPGVNNTDGISSTQQIFPLYPMGLFVALDDDTSVTGVGWDKILTQTGLSCGN